MAWLHTALALIVVAILAVLNLEGYSADRRALAAAALLLYAIILLVYRRRLRPEGAAGPSDYLVAYATETGTARQFAKATSRRLAKKGIKTAVTELNRLAEVPPPGQALLVIASTTGNGASPRTGDSWLAQEDFLKQYNGCKYAVLALGDRDYPQFCAFGLSVAASLAGAGARPLFDPIQVNRADPASLDYWYRQLGLR